MELFKNKDYYLAVIIKSKARKEVWRIKKIMATEKDVDTNSNFFKMFYKGAFCYSSKNVMLEKAEGMWETCGFKELAKKAIRKRRTDAVVAVKKEVLGK
jgi:GH43 family beta-xylosidase